MAKNSPILLKSKEFAHKVTPANLSPVLGAFLLRLNDVEKCKKTKCGGSWGGSCGGKIQKKNTSKQLDEYKKIVKKRAKKCLKCGIMPHKKRVYLNKKR